MYRLNDRLLYCYRHLYIYAETPGVGRLTQLRFGKESLLNLQRQVVTVLGSIPARCSCWVSQTIYRFNSGGCQLFFSSQYWWLSTPSPAETLHNGPNGGSSGVAPRQSQAESTELDASIIFFTQFGCCIFFCCECSRVQY